MPHSSPWSLFIVAVAVAVAFALNLKLAQIGRADPGLRPAARYLTVFVWAWLAFALGLSLVGFFGQADRFQRSDWPGFIAFAGLMFTLPTLFAVGMLRSATLRRLISRFSTAWLVGVQVYRTAGVVFLVLLAQGSLPYWFGWSTGVADILVGVTALPLAWALATRRAWARPAALLWCVVGLLDFLNAVPYVVLSFLGVIDPQPAPAMIGLHPLALVALFQVPLAMIFHAIVLVRLLQRREDSSIADERL
jgi:hypothetical protein